MNITIIICLIFDGKWSVMYIDIYPIMMTECIFRRTTRASEASRMSGSSAV